MEIPHRLRCPITDELMTDPVMLVESGNIYEKCAIKKWLSIVKTDPLTNAEIKREDLAPVHLLRSECKEFEQKMRNPENNPLFENSQSPLITKATELEVATQSWREKIRKIQELEKQGQKIDDNLVESSKEFQKEFKKFMGACNSLDNINKDLKKMCVDNIKNTPDVQIAQKLGQHKLAQHKIIQEGKTVEQFVNKLLESKARQKHHKQILNPIKQEEQKLHEDIEGKKKQLQQLTAQLTEQEFFEKKNFQALSPELQVPQSSSNNLSSQLGQENTQNQNKMKILSLQDLLKKLEAGCVTNACVNITENCDRIVCTVNSPITIKKLNVVRVHQQEETNFSIIFEGKENITIEDSKFTGLGLQFNGVSHNSDQIIRMTNNVIINSPTNGLFFEECSFVDIQNSQILGCKQNSCSFINSSGKMTNCILKDHRLYGVHMRSSALCYKNVTTNQKETKLVQTTFSSKWIKIAN